MTARHLIALLAAAGLLTGCSKEDSKPTGPASGSGVGDAVKQAADDAADAAGPAADDLTQAADDAKEALTGQAQELKAKALAQAEDQITLLEAQLKGLESKLGTVPEPLRGAAQPLVEAARARFAEITPKLNALKAAGADAWEAASGELTGAIDALEQAIKSAASNVGG